MSFQEGLSNLITSDFVTLAGTFFYLGNELPLDFSGAAAFTLEGWFRFSSLAAAVPVFSRAGELVFGLTRKGHVFARRRFWETPLISQTALKPEKWCHVGLRCDGDRWELFIGGAREGASDFSIAEENASAELGTPLRSANLGCEVWNLRIWNRALAPEAMLQAMRSRMVAPEGLIAAFFPEMPVAKGLRIGVNRKISAA